MHVTGSERPGYELDEIQRGLAALLDSEYVPVEYVWFRLDLLSAQWAVRQAIDGRADAVAGEPQGAASAAGPALAAGDVVFDHDSLLTLFAALCRAVEAQGRQSEDANRLEAAAREDSGLLATLAERASFGPDHSYLESVGRRLEVGADSLLFFGRALAAPFVSAAADRARQCVDSRQLTGGCELCGSPPSIAELRAGDGKRVMHCSLCGQSHLVPRLDCPHCGSVDREGLVYLRVSADDPRWIEACEGCGKYVKVIDARRLPDDSAVIPLVEDVATVHLDLLAEREGYHRRVPHVALV